MSDSQATQLETVMNAIRALTFIVFAVATVSLTFAAEAATQPASQPTTRPAAAERLAKLIEAVKDADSPSAAMSAYARGCGIDRLNADLQNAYMRKMLTFGLPKIGYYAARVLVSSQPDNGMAWGLVGYVHGRRGEIDKAFNVTIRAAALAPDDPSIMHNAGQLVAWYENELLPPKPPDVIRRILERVRPKLAKNADFVKAYNQMAGAYAKQAAVTAELSERLVVAATQVEQQRDEAQAIDIQLRAISDEIDYRNSVIQSLYEELYAYTVHVIQTPDGVEYVRVPSSGRHRAEIRARIRAEERAIDELEIEARKLRRQGQLVLVNLARAQQSLQLVQTQLDSLGAQAQRTFRWDPPAVDGKVTDELERFPLVSHGRPALVKGPEDEANEQLAMARLYIRNSMKDKAIAILQELIVKHKTTEAAAEAKIVLATLRRSE